MIPTSHTTGKICRRLPLGLAAATIILAGGAVLANAHPEMDACGRDLTQDAWAQPCQARIEATLAGEHDLTTQSLSPIFICPETGRSTCARDPK